jgi:hypothetical protein
MVVLTPPNTLARLRNVTPHSGCSHLTKITRKDFLGLSAAAVTSAVFGKTTSANALQVTAA